MATAHVQTKDAQGTGGALTQAVTLTGVGAGNHLLAWTAVGTGTSTTIGATTSSPSATWTTTDAQINSGTAAGGQFQYSQNVASGSWTVTAHASPSDFITICVGESSGVATTASLDGTFHGTSQSTSAATLATATLTSVTAGDIVWTATADNGGETTADTINQSFVISSDLAAWNGVNLRAGMAHLDNIASSTLNPTWTLPASHGVISSIAAFKAASSSGLPPGLGPTEHMQPAMTMPIGW